ncbi:DUF4870 domain-containing protein [Thermococcus sp.]|uniref:DUF4870 domain-containing protein n=1 Tax=Thermococcus sp. TaxID=35749 RepID=UPI00261CB416|nr:DUF4870 domain-containing protein [Thermococcus sp.]
MENGTPRKGRTSLGLDENVEGMLAYLLGPITGIILLILEKESDFVRFHAMQSTIAFLSLWVLQIILRAVFSPLGTLVGLLELVVWIVGMVKAYQGERYKFPIVGDLAEQWLEKV